MLGRNKFAVIEAFFFFFWRLLFAFPLCGGTFRAKLLHWLDHCTPTVPVNRFLKNPELCCRMVRDHFSSRGEVWCILAFSKIDKKITAAQKKIRKNCKWQAIVSSLPRRNFKSALLKLRQKLSLMWTPFNMGAYGRKNASRRMWTGTELRSPLRNFAEKNTRDPECDLVSLYFFS